MTDTTNKIPRWTCPGIEYPDDRPKTKVKAKPIPKQRGRKLTWSIQEVIDLVNNEKLNLVNAAKRIPSVKSSGALLQGLNRHGYSYDRKRVWIEKLKKT
jgi:hypothetical protein